MDPNIDQRLAAIEKKLDENTTILKKMRRSQRAAAVMKVFYWVLLIVLGFVSLSFIKPYLIQLKDAYGLGDTSSNSKYQELLDSIK